VHGIDSSAQTWASTQPPDGGRVTGTNDSPLAYVVNSLGSAKVAGYTFDWSAASGEDGPVEWVTSPPSPDLAARLAQAIGCVAKAAGHPVIIIAHSMGGLIAEKASTLGPTGVNGKPTDIAAVFTLGTPYRGSWLASSAVGQGPDPTMNLIGQSLGALCSTQSTGTTPPPSNPSVKSHKKPPGLIDKAAAAACHLVKTNERNDPGVVAMRLKPGPQTMLPPPPANLPWYRLAASVQGELRPVWPLQISESLNDVGDGVVSTSSQLNGQPGTAQTTQICTVTGTAGHGRSARPVPRQPSFFDALNSPCFHTHEPHSKTLLDDIIGIIRAKHMIPAASVGPSGTTPTAYVADSGGGAGDTVTPIDLATGTRGSPITVGNYPEGIAITPDGKTAYVTNFNDGTVTPIDLATGTPGPPITVGKEPEGIAITPDGKTAYVANAGDGTVTPITLATSTPGPPIIVGNGPLAIAITPDGKTAYVADGGGGNGNTVTPIDLATGAPGPPITVGNYPYAIAITPDGKTAYAASFDPNGTITPITVATDTPGAAIPVGQYPSSIAITPDGNTAYVTNGVAGGGSTVTPIDLATGTLGPPITVGKDPEGIAITQDGKTAYVANFDDGTVTPIDLATGTPGAPISAGSYPVAIAITPTATSTSTPGHTPTTVGPAPTSVSTPAGQGVQITRAETYQKGALVYFRIYYSDPDNDAEGFGFVGVNGSRFAEETHPFSSPSYGIVGPGRIDYPFNLGCGTSQQTSPNDVKAWIYDTAGVRSTPVVIRLSCKGSVG
jgi:YVTN family beta-propeller protein